MFTTCINCARETALVSPGQAELDRGPSPPPPPASSDEQVSFVASWEKSDEFLYVYIRVMSNLVNHKVELFLGKAWADRNEQVK